MGPMKLSNEDKKTLMEIAKQAVNKAVHSEKIPDFHIESELLKEDCGAFVTLRKHGKLRGCIGYATPIKSLFETVRDVAESAALRDPRFPPVKPKELKDINFEISVMTPLKIIRNIEEIVVGKHGLVIEQKFSRGLLLPQVATEAGWDRHQFLEHTCQKAGLPLTAWKDKDTKISIFSAIIFSEEDLA